MRIQLGFDMFGACAAIHRLLCLQRPELKCRVPKVPIIDLATIYLFPISRCVTNDGRHALLHTQTPYFAIAQLLLLHRRFPLRTTFMTELIHIFIIIFFSLTLSTSRKLDTRHTLPLEPLKMKLHKVRFVRHSKMLKIYYAFVCFAVVAIHSI